MLLDFTPLWIIRDLPGHKEPRKNGFPMREGKIRLSLGGLLDCELLHLFAEFLRSSLCSSIFPPSLRAIKSLPTLLKPSLHVVFINRFSC